MGTIVVNEVDEVRCRVYGSVMSLVVSACCVKQCSRC